MPDRPTNRAASPRIEWLDLFRGLAAVAVVMYHYRQPFGLDWFNSGFIAVDLFFVLSGIVLGGKYTAAIEGGLSFGEFAWLRLSRLYPMALIAGLFIVCLNLIHAPSGRWVPAADFGAWSVLLVFPYPNVPGNLSGAFPADGPVWSLWAELVVNALWFFILKRGRSWVAIVGLISMVGTLMMVWRFDTLDFGTWAGATVRVQSVIRAMMWFVAGYWMATSRPRPIARPAVLLAAFAAVLALYAVALEPGWLYSIASATIGVALLHSLYEAPPPARWIARIARWLGLASYPLYLIHAPVGRLLAFLGSDHSVVAILVAMSAATVIATVLNERLVAAAHEIRRRRARAVRADQPT